LHDGPPAGLKIHRTADESEGRVTLYLT